MLKRDNIRPIIITFQRFISPFRDSNNILLRAPTGGFSSEHPLLLHKPSEKKSLLARMKLSIWWLLCRRHIWTVNVISPSRARTFLASSSTHLFPSAPARTRAAHAPEATAGPHGQARWVPHHTKQRISPQTGPLGASPLLKSAPWRAYLGTRSRPYHIRKEKSLIWKMNVYNVYRFSSSRRNCWVGSIFCFA